MCHYNLYTKKASTAKLAELPQEEGSVPKLFWSKHTGESAHICGREGVSNFEKKPLSEHLLGRRRLRNEGCGLTCVFSCGTHWNRERLRNAALGPDGEVPGAGFARLYTRASSAHATDEHVLGSSGSSGRQPCGLQASAHRLFLDVLLSFPQSVYNPVDVPSPPWLAALQGCTPLRIVFARRYTSQKGSTQWNDAADYFQFLHSCCNVGRCPGDIFLRPPVQRRCRLACRRVFRLLSRSMWSQRKYVGM